ncbi:hypothetical protein HMPREF1051_3124 [Neisseria sicca VK64]|uniref:Uncharacterized protein n=1 Tax=Neisseria sicca VK64 TaxID=1095748 RepID=I2NVE3_NEISI|nr:hypothetical protein HMPREF1051_3124 [Neisseria sicca VK64]
MPTKNTAQPVLKKQIKTSSETQNPAFQTTSFPIIRNTIFPHANRFIIVD